MKRILMPLATYGFDPTESAIPWKLLTERGIKVVFATPSGDVPKADEIMLNGNGLGIFRALLVAKDDAIIAYKNMEQSKEFLSPIRYEDIKVDEYDGIFLPGGHHKGVREYLESSVLQEKVVEFFRMRKKVAAICHGPLLLARSIDASTGKSVIYEYKTTSLLKKQELLAYYLTRHNLGDYYLTYPGQTVEDEVKKVLASEKQFIHGPVPLFRDSETNLRWGFKVVDRNYTSARWPGDVYNLTFAFIDMLLE